MPTGYTLPYDTPLNKQAKANSIVTSNVREHLKSLSLSKKISQCQGLHLI